jgi:hypothetical protein
LRFLPAPTYTVTTAGFTPAALWLASENGDWFDTNDLATMYQDDAGTLAVTAVGQPVKRWVGKRGAIALTAGSKSGAVLRQTAGGKYYLEFGGSSVSSGLSVASAAISGASGVRTAAAGFAVDSAASARNVIDADDGGASRVAQLVYTTATGTVEAKSFGSTNTSDNSGVTVAANTPITAVTINRGTGSTLEVFAGGSSNGGTALASAPRTNSTVFAVGLRGITSYQCNIYGAVVQIGRAIDATERANLEAYIGARLA